MPSLHLRVSCPTTVFGEVVAALGSWNAWDKNNPTLLSTSSTSFPSWHATVPLPNHSPVEYKYLIMRAPHIVRWEAGPKGANRTATPGKEHDTEDIFGTIPGPQNAHHEHISPTPNPPAQAKWAPNGVTVSAAETPVPALDPVEAAILRVTREQRSWRQRLSYVRSLLTERSVASEASFDPRNVDHLATVSVFLTFLGSGQVRCEEDGGHHRPNHHANEARRLEGALATVMHAVEHGDGEEASRGKEAYIPYVVRKIFPQLPSYSQQFTASVPLTRIRDIAHRGDIPHEFKQEIKHTLQNKLHRCAGPEDLQTSARLLERINQGDYSHGLKEQFNIFHRELLDFFNAASLDDRLRYLQGNRNTKPVSQLAARLLDAKVRKEPALLQMEILTELREGIAELPVLHVMASGEEKDEELPSEDVQKTRLTDIDLEGYAFMLLAGVAKEAEQQQKADFDWNSALRGLSLSLENIALSGICRAEARATANELIPAGEQAEEGELLRVKAAVDRALRFAERFSASISDVFTRRATSIGQALGVDEHSVAVFAEAEIRSNITFQASRIADACAQTCRRALSLPPWDPLYAGEAQGKVVRVDHLSQLKASEGGDVIAICRDAEGDEDIPANVRGVVLGRSLPHLSHLGVRARQAGIVFVCAEEREAFEKVWRDKGVTHVFMEVNAGEGLKSFTKLDQKDLKSPPDKDAKTNGNVNVTFDASVKRPIPITEATTDTASSKCTFAGKLRCIAERSDNAFEAPNGVALPHGMFQSQCSKHSEDYTSLIRRYSEEFSAPRGASDAAARSLSDFVESIFKLETEHCKRIQNAFREGRRVMVRSSANAEDLEDMSGAGLYDSIANVPVHSTEALQKATSRVWASLWTKRAASSRASYGVPHEQVSMAVLIQEMVTADLSFVAFSQDPVTEGNDGVYIEVAIGMGETLASAASTGSPYRFRVDRKTLDVDTISFASYSEALVPNASGDGLRIQVVDYCKQPMTISEHFRTKLVQRIAKAVVLLEKELAGPQDIEGAITGSNERANVYIVQARPQILSTDA